ncbi:MAG: TraB/GumN family protein [Pseudomonadota bacterium]|nr:TraB/GumN family protein [Pseudomonadota bacterium]
MRHLKSFALSAVIVAGLLSINLFSPNLSATPSTASAGDGTTAAAPVSPIAIVTESVHTAPTPLLWKLSNADNTVYLLGSFHLLKADDYPLSVDVDNAFAAADKVVFEVPPDQLFDPATAQKFMVAAGYADGGSLSEVLPAAMREKFNHILARSGSSIAQFDGFEPWFVNLSLMLGVSQSMGFSGENGLDQHLIREAGKAGKPTGGLESIDDQLNALDSTPMHEQVMALAEFIDSPEAMPGMLTGLHGAWRSADLDQLDRLAVREMRQKTPETYRLINVARNDAWVPQIQSMLEDAGDGNTLVVVGALHLLGEDGLVEQLRAKGYAVVRICSACQVEAEAGEVAVGE